MNPKIRYFPLAEYHDYLCPACEIETTIETRETEYKLPYGEGDQSVEISVILPLRRCKNCGFEFFDAEAEDKKHEAVCRYLGLMTPQEIQSLRDKYKLSRVEFAKLTKLGEATIGRWERGELIQNAANDQLLYLLTFSDNLIRLRNRTNNNTIVKEDSVEISSFSFRVIKPTPSLLEQASGFCLNMTGAIA